MQLNEVHVAALEKLFIFTPDTLAPDTDFLAVRPAIVEDTQDDSIEFMLVDASSDIEGFGYVTMTPEDALQFAANIIEAARCAIGQREVNRLAATDEAA